jgi:hypothetical protein
MPAARKIVRIKKVIPNPETSKKIRKIVIDYPPFIEYSSNP